MSYRVECNVALFSLLPQLPVVALPVSRRSNPFVTYIYIWLLIVLILA